MNPSPAPITFISTDDWRWLELAGRHAFSNPFQPSLGAAGDIPTARLLTLLERVRDALLHNPSLTDTQRTLYVEACLHYLFETGGARLQALIEKPAAAAGPIYRDFVGIYRRLLVVRGLDLQPLAPEHLFACCYQRRRAHHHISSCVIGSSAPAAKLRADIWQAIFTYDLRRYTHSCDRRRLDISTLIVGPSGTGKELAAQAIGRSSYIPFDTQAERFVEAEDERFYGVNLSALSDSLFEAELFGHERGAFTGAVKDRRGVLSACRDGVVLFDEIGELPLARQVTLLRVLEARCFHRVGDTELLKFSARVLAATHRDLAGEIEQGAFRLDLYERLAGIQIHTPSLLAQFESAPGERRELVRFLATERVEPDEPDEVDDLTDRVEAFIDKELPRYSWPGNVRELKRCVESVYATGTFVPLRKPTAKVKPAVHEDDPLESVRELKMSEEEVVRRYASMAFEKLGERQDETARLLKINRKTVAARLDYVWLAQRALRRRA